MSLDFSGCWAKVRRAQEHHTLLETGLERTFRFKKNRVTFGVKFDPNANREIVYISRVPDLRNLLTEVAVVAGDAIQNLRASLDHLMWQLALDYTTGAVESNPKRERRVQFPIIADPKDWPSTVKGTLADIDPRHHAIIERFQPYSKQEPFDGPLIGTLAEFSNADKHRLLIPVLIPPVDVDTAFDAVLDLLKTMNLPSFKGFTVENARMALDAPFVEMPVSNRLFKRDVKVAGTFAPTLAFTQERPVKTTLEVLTAAVTRVIREFDPLP